MSGWKTQKELQINGRPVVGARQAADILTKRAKDEYHNFERNYSRDTIYQHYKAGRLVPAVEAPTGNLYYVEDIYTLPMTPHIGAKSQKSRPKRLKNVTIVTSLSTIGQNLENSLKNT